MSTPGTSTRHFRYAVLAEELQREIEQGIYPVGSKMPSERALARKYDVTHITVRQSFDVLERQGLVIRTPGSGTYVNATLERPIIGILFGPKLTEESAHFYRSLLSSLERYVDALSCRCRSYDGFNDANVEIADQYPAYQALLSDAKHHPFKAYIKISVNDPGWGTIQPLKGLPLSSFGLLKSEFTHDYYGFAEDCMEHAMQCGFRKMLYIRGFSSISDDLKAFKDVAKRHNIAVPDCIQLDGYHTVIKPDAAAHMEIRRLVAQWKRADSWPDVIIVSDDIVTRGVALGLIEAGNEAVKRVAVITHVNEGVEHHYGIPTIRYAFSPAEVGLRLCERLQQHIENPHLPPQPQAKLRGKLLALQNGLHSPVHAFGLAAH